MVWFLWYIPSFSLFKENNIVFISCKEVNPYCVVIRVFYLESVTVSFTVSLNCIYIYQIVAVLLRSDMFQLNFKPISDRGKLFCCFEFGFLTAFIRLINHWHLCLITVPDCSQFVIYMYFSMCPCIHHCTCTYYRVYLVIWICG